MVGLESKRRSESARSRGGRSVQVRFTLRLFEPGRPPFVVRPAASFGKRDSMENMQNLGKNKQLHVRCSSNPCLDLGQSASTQESPRRLHISPRAEPVSIPGLTRNRRMESPTRFRTLFCSIAEHDLHCPLLGNALLWSKINLKELRLGPRQKVFSRHNPSLWNENSKPKLQVSAAWCRNGPKAKFCGCWVTTSRPR